MLDGRNKEWTYGYDDMGRLTSVTPPGLPASTREYDAAGNLWKITDANGHNTTYTYDLSNKLSQIEDAAHHLTTLEYNSDGELIRQIDPEGKEIRPVVPFARFPIRPLIVFHQSKRTLHTLIYCASHKLL